MSLRDSVRNPAMRTRFSSKPTFNKKEADSCELSASFLQYKRVIWFAAQRFPCKNAVFECHIAMCGIIFRDGH